MTPLPETASAPQAIERLDSRLLELRREAEALLDTLDRTTGDVDAALRAQLARRPYRTLAAAAAVGYLLGGGLGSRLTRIIVALGGRIGVEYLYRQLGARLLADLPAGDEPTQSIVRQSW